MSCIKLSPPPLPTISGGVSIPVPTLPDFSGGVDLCCKINVALFVTLPNVLPIPFLGAALDALDAYIATADAYLAAVDLISFSCPLD
jgi:hypothetical protein